MLQTGMGNIIWQNNKLGAYGDTKTNTSEPTDEGKTVTLHMRL